MSQASEERRTEMKLTDAFEAHNCTVHAFASFVVEDGKPGAERARLPGPAHQGSSPDALSRPDLVAGANDAVLKVRPAPGRRVVHLPRLFAVPGHDALVAHPLDRSRRIAREAVSSTINTFKPAPPPASDPRPQPLRRPRKPVEKILRERFARGEITAEEYQRSIESLRGATAREAPDDTREDR